MLLFLNKKEEEKAPPIILANAPDSVLVALQLERILASELFQHSKRYPKFLKYVVEQTLQGNSAHLKERTLGIAVFSRAPEYDTSADPVVRNTASEVRKRLEEYYRDPDHQTEVRIALPVGSYVPEFGYPNPPPTPAIEDRASAHSQARSAPWTARTWALVSLVAVLALVAGTWFFWPNPAIDRFWAPVIKNSSPVVIVMGPIMGLPEAKELSVTGTGAVSNKVDPKLYLLLTNLHAKMGSFLEAHGKKFDFVMADDTDIARLRRAPFILMGAFNNSWTLRTLKPFRFYLELDRDHHIRGIADRENPLRTDWRVPMSPDITEDYALIVRAVDPFTGQWTVVVAGMGEKGSAAGADFVTEPKYLEHLARQAPRDWHRRNMEIVIETKLVNGDWGEPSIVASHFW